MKELFLYNLYKLVMIHQVVGERDKLQQLVDRLQGELLDAATKHKRLDTRLKVVREEGEEEREKLAAVSYLQYTVIELLHIVSCIYRRI